jgi:hypothetical protein
MSWDSNQRFNGRVAHRVSMTERKREQEQEAKKQRDAEMAVYEARPKFELIKACPDRQGNWS